MSELYLNSLQGFLYLEITNGETRQSQLAKEKNVQVHHVLTKKITVLKAQTLIA